LICFWPVRSSRSEEARSSAICRKASRISLLDGRSPLGEELREVLQDPLDHRHVGFITLDQQLVSTPTDPDAQQRLEIFDVLVVGAEERFKPLLRYCNLQTSQTVISSLPISNGL
jgi:hypothetical protein